MHEASSPVGALVIFRTLVLSSRLIQNQAKHAHSRTFLSQTLPEVYIPPQVEYGVYGDLIIIYPKTYSIPKPETLNPTAYPKPHSIYLRGTIALETEVVVSSL